MSIDILVVRKSLADLGNNVQLSSERLVQTLDQALRTVIRRSNRAPKTCNNCSQIYPHGYDACPYCGKTDTDHDLDLSPVQTNIAPSGIPEVEVLVRRIEQLGRSSMRSLYEIGQLFAKIQDSECWASDGSTPADTFGEWVEARTGWSWSTVTRLITVARSYTSEQIETTTRIRISGLLEIEKVMRQVPPEQREMATSTALERVSAEEKPTRQKAATIAKAVREEVTGYLEVVDIVEQYQPDEVIAEPTQPSIAVFSSHKFSVPYTSQRYPGAVTIGDVFRVDLPNGLVVEAKLGADTVECYLFNKKG